MHKCNFGATEIDFRGRTITPAGVNSQRPRVQNFLENTNSQIQKRHSNVIWDFPTTIGITSRGSRKN